ncbi:site-specific integrase [Enterococcus casseliflavus]|uniref:site-specific integrase n=1 Tax=Enterococcus casseliflavus TaxID=37734 RepID=UPI0022E8894D|nr:site-specific integrase [Enterococcus casseliflavus]
MAMIKQYLKKNGEKAWYFKTYLGIDPVSRKKKYTTKRGFKTQKEARLALSRLELEIETRGVTEKSNDVTFREVYELWIEHYKSDVKKSTLSRTTLIFDKHILPKFGNLPIKEITVAYCQKVVTEWSKTGTSKQYPLFVNYISKVFKMAINLEIVENNPVANVIIPKNKSAEKKLKVKYYTKAELQVFLNTVNKENSEFFRIRDYALFRLLAFSGCRIGECLALSWNDIDFETKELTISKTVTKAKDYYVSEKPKTTASNRRLILDERTIASLKEWKLLQMKYLFQIGFNKPAFIFTNEKNTFTINQAVTERFKIYSERADLPNIGLHGFRHTHASLLFEADASMKEVQERLGHANIKTTMDTYTHMTKDKKIETTNKLVNYVNF